MATAHRYTDLDAWKLSAELRRVVRRLIAAPAFDREPELRWQLRRSASGPCPNIAEGFSRFNPKDFARFLRIALGSLAETIDHLESGVEAGLFTRSEAEPAMTLARRATGACTKLAIYLDTAEPPARERPPKPKSKKPSAERTGHADPNREP